MSVPPTRPFQDILAGPAAKLDPPIQFPSPTPCGPNRRGRGGGALGPTQPGWRRSPPPLGTAASRSRGLSAAFAVSRSLSASLSPAPFSLQPPQKYIVFSPNPVQLQHNKTHNKNLIHFSPSPPPPSPGIFLLGIKNLSSCLWHRSPGASASLMYEPGS